MLLRNYRSETDAASALFADYGESLGSLYSGSATDWNQIGSLCAQARESAARLDEICGGSDVRVQCCGRGEIRGEIEGMIEKMPPLISLKSDLDETIDTSYCVSDDWISSQISVCDDVTSHFDELKEWITWNSISKEAEDCGLGCVIAAYAQGTAHEDIEGGFRKLVAKFHITIKSSQIFSKQRKIIKGIIIVLHFYPPSPLTKQCVLTDDGVKIHKYVGNKKGVII